MVDTVATIYGDKIKFYKYDTQNFKEFAQQYGIRGIPHTIIFKESNIIDKIPGYLSRDKLEPKIKDLIKKYY